MSNKSSVANWPAIFLVLFGGAAALGATVYVDSDGHGDFDNIQAAIDAAANGQTIVVTDGTYTGDGNRDIDFRGKAVTVRSENGPANCIIGCGGSESDQHMGFYFHSGETPESVLDGFTITNGYHEDAGAIFCTYVDVRDPRPSNPTIINCIITNNQGTYAGGIRCRSHCWPLISDCIISDNIGAYTGGISYADESRPVVINCIVRGNTGRSGGGIRTGGAGCHGTILNCLISGNSCTEGAAGVEWWAYGGSVAITNCTIVNNVGKAGILIGGGGNPTGTIANCIVRGNMSEWGPAQIEFWQMTADVTRCNVEGGWPGQGNINADPLFVDADGADDVYGTQDDNYRLLGASACLDAGDNSALPPEPAADLDGNPRIINGTVDMGAYEGPNQGLVVVPRSVTVGEGRSASFTVALGTDPAGSVEVAAAVTSGDSDIAVASGATLIFDPADYSQPQTVTLAAAEDSDHLNGTAVVSVSAAGFATIAVGVTEDENDHVLYVDADAPGADTGFGWADAFEYLQDALSAAAANPHVTEIRVAEGTYKPDQGAGRTPGDREAAFGLVNGVAVKGSYAGYGEPDPHARDVEAYQTILSGDLNGDDAQVADPCDLRAEPTRTENSYHVVLWEGVGPPYFDFKENTGLDGFTVTGGNANKSGFGEQSVGGGISEHGWGDPTVSNCRIVGNAAESGGGVWASSCVLAGCVITGNAAWDGGAMRSYSSLVTDCIISGNYAEDRGGGISMWEGDARFERCTVNNNRTGREGGGIFIADAEPVLVDCTFRGNSAVAGGAVAADHFDNAANPLFIGCAFIGNDADLGGGMYSYSSYSTLTNCIFSGNSAEEGGGMASHFRNRARMVNCTFVGNSATKGRSLSFDSDEPPHRYPSDAQLSNCILWDGGDEIFNGDGSEINITYSDVRGGWPGESNIDADPRFAGPADGDYHLKSQAGRWDANEGRWTADDVTSPGIDAGDPGSPIGHEPFGNGGIINMGAYGGTSQASKSYFGEPVCETIVAGDINGDCKVDFADFAIMALHWLEDNSEPQPAM